MRFLPIFLFFVFLVFVPSFSLGRRVTSFGHLESWQSIGRTQPDRLIPVTLALKQKDPAALDRLFHQISDPKSSRYSQCSTHSELRSILSDPQAVSATVNWLVDNGAKDMNVHPTGDIIKAKFTVAEFERLFQSEVHDFQPLRSSAPRVTIRRAHHFTVPSALQPHVEHLFTINHFPSVKPPRVFASKPLDSQGNVDPATMNSVYSIDDNTVTNSRSTQGVFESDMQSYNPEDLAAYQKQFHLPVDQSMVSVFGPNDPQSCVSNPDNCGESMLDIEIINAVAQKAKLVFYGIVRISLSFTQAIHSTLQIFNMLIVFVFSFSGSK
jgi:subtilase family serine protease